MRQCHLLHDGGLAHGDEAVHAANNVAGNLSCSAVDDKGLWSHQRGNARTQALLRLWLSIKSPPPTVAAIADPADMLPEARGQRRKVA